ncbi:TolC family protein [Lyticum sinuosum]|uniref:Outer membrane protein TolC n=1 Tax=Lyticum sinuosum TaxID=1332059 RepID=A0AAE4VJY1_9RICK|nr:TolC family protein [Lyticum sinuosum]MDZ5761142.1 Outer membrane protein TolC [Lyticum sinuosum]
MKTLLFINNRLFLYKFLIYSILLLIIYQKYVFAQQDTNILINVEKAIELALDNSDIIKSSQENVKTGQAIKQANISKFLPNVYLTHNREELYNSSYINNNNYYRIDKINLFKGGSLHYEQNIFNSLSDIYNLKSAQANLDSLKARFKNDKASLIANTINVYQNVIYSRLKLDLSNNQNFLLKKNLHNIEIKWKYGLANTTDLEEAKAQLSMSEAEIATSEEEKNNSEELFKQIVGINPPNNMKKIILTKEFSNFDEINQIEKITLKKNKTLIHLQKLYEKSVNDVKAQFGNLGPKVDLYAVANRKNDVIAQNIYGGTRIGIKVNIPIFHGGIEYANIKLTKSQRESIKFQLNNERKKILSKIRYYFWSINTSKIKINAYKADIVARNSQNKALKSEYEAGIKTMIDVIKGEVDLFNSKIRLLQEENIFIELVVGFHYLIGDLEEIKKISNN